jgi:V/A-type H+-transporting ATPase subunit E
MLHRVTGVEMKGPAMARTLGDIANDLTEKVLSPAKAESERILRDARTEAEKIVAEAKGEASRVKEAARQEAAQVLKQMDVDMNTAARNFILLLQERLEKAIVQPTVEEEIKGVLKDREFLKRMIEILLKEFSRLHGSENKIEVLLPEKEKAEMEKLFVEKFHQKAIGHLNVRFTDKISFGFKIGVEDTGSHFNFGEGLVEVFTEFCSPRFRKYFFGAQAG